MPVHRENTNFWKQCIFTVPHKQITGFNMNGAEYYVHSDTFMCTVYGCMCESIYADINLW